MSLDDEPGVTGEPGVGGRHSGEPLPAQADLERRADALLGMAFRLAGEPLEGINEVAEQLASLAEDDRHVLERARRVSLRLAERSPSDLTRQVVSLLRRALEVGHWRWEDPSNYS